MAMVGQRPDWRKMHPCGDDLRGGGELGVKNYSSFG